MITLNQIADNIHEMMYPNTLTLEGEISIRQIKHWIHYHRAKLIADNIDKGILNDQSIYQPMALTLRNSTSDTFRLYYKAWDAYDKDPSLSPPSLTTGTIENSPRFSSGKLTGEWIPYGSMSADPTGNSQRYQDSLGRDFYGREIKRSQLRGDFRNLGIQSFWVPRPIMLKNNAGIRRVNLSRHTHFPDDISTPSEDEQITGYDKREITLLKKDSHLTYYDYNKFTDNTKPYYIQQHVVMHNRSDGNSHQNVMSLRNLQISPNYHGGLKTPGAEKIFWKYRASASMILENPTDVDMMWGWSWSSKEEWNDAVTPYPIPMEYLSDLIQRVLQQESSYSLKTMADE